MARVEAVRIQGAGGVEVLRLGEIEVPEPGPGEVRLTVAASGLNRADLLQRLGRYPAPEGVPPDVPGLEVAGEVLDVGPGVEGWRPGDRVMALLAGGGMARQAVVPAGQLLPWPDGLSAAEAAVIPEAFLTAYDALVLQGRLSAGETLLVHAVGSGVGSAAVQLGVWVGARVLGTSRTPAKIEAARGIGLAEGRAAGDDLPDWVRAASGGRGADVILDLLGGALAPATLRALAAGGRWLMVGLLAGARAEVDLGRLMARRVTLIGTVLRARSREEKADLVSSFSREVLPAFAERRLRPVLAETFAPSEVARAHRRLEAGAVFGKIAVVWEGAAPHAP